jgi:methionyl-tRNA synthetase
VIKFNNEKEKFYITTAIPYINAPPHIGHILEFAQTDALARSYRLLGKDVFLLTGSDENSLKNVQAAEEIGITTQQLCDKNAEIFKQVAITFGLSFNKFLRTSRKDEHWTGIRKLWNLCVSSGDVYWKKYSGLYCVGCEAFYNENELVNGLCPEHNTRPELIEEGNYFFRLSKYQDKLKELIESGKLKIIPEKRKKEVLNFIKKGLEDFSISRSQKRAKGWGIPVPSDDSQIIYVWVDALGTYLTGIGFGKNEEEFEKWWPADIHVIGKGITRFHAIYWPAIILSAGLKLPKTIFIHGYVTVGGQKISKSIGNIIDPRKLIEKFDIDSVRYYLLNEIPPFDDGDFSLKRLIEKSNNELVANLGNLIYRVLSFIKMNFNSTVPEPDELKLKDKNLIKKIEQTKKTVKKAVLELKLKDALRKVFALSKAGNKYFQEKKPWESLKKNSGDCRNALYVAANLIRSLTILIEPFLPFTAERLWQQLNLEGSVHSQSFETVGKLELKPGHKIGAIEPLFKKFETKIEEN